MHHGGQPRLFGDKRGGENEDTSRGSGILPTINIPKENHNWLNLRYDNLLYFSEFELDRVLEPCRKDGFLESSTSSYSSYSSFTSHTS